jgi:hypothetical protein
MTRKTLQRLGYEIERPTKDTFLIADGSKVVPLGRLLNVPVRFGPITIPVDMTVVENGHYDFLLGNSWLNAAKAVIDYTAEEMRITNKGRTLKVALSLHRRVRPKFQYKETTDESESEISASEESESTDTETETASEQSVEEDDQTESVSDDVSEQSEEFKQIYVAEIPRTETSIPVQDQNEIRPLDNEPNCEEEPSNSNQKTPEETDQTNDDSSDEEIIASILQLSSPPQSPAPEYEDEVDKTRPAMPVPSTDQDQQNLPPQPQQKHIDRTYGRMSTGLRSHANVIQWINRTKQLSDFQ